MVLYQFDGDDSGNFRVYYRGGKHLYCIQNDGSWSRDRFVFYACSRDGEPSHELRMPLDSSFDQKVMPASIDPRAKEEG